LFVKKASQSKYANPMAELEDQVAGRVINSSATTSPSPAND